MSDEISSEYVTNYEQFCDILSSFLIERIAAPFSKPKPKPKRRSKKASQTNTPYPTDTPDTDDNTVPSADDLADFTSYIATTTFLTLPIDLQSLTHHTWTSPSENKNSSLQSLHPLPLTPERTTPLLQTLDPSIPDSLTTYGITAPEAQTETPSNLPSPAEFFAPIFTAYITTVTAPPPPPRSTKADAAGCEICGRDWINLSYHRMSNLSALFLLVIPPAGDFSPLGRKGIADHRPLFCCWTDLIPRMVHDKVVKRGWHREDELQNVAWLCGACHRFVHRFRGHEELAREYFTVERLLQAEEVRRFAGWYVHFYFFFFHFCWALGARSFPVH
jgi:hypothetical protein